MNKKQFVEMLTEADNTSVQKSFESIMKSIRQAQGRGENRIILTAREHRHYCERLRVMLEDLGLIYHGYREQGSHLDKVSLTWELDKLKEEANL